MTGAKFHAAERLPIPYKPTTVTGWLQPINGSPTNDSSLQPSMPNYSPKFKNRPTSPRSIWKPIPHLHRIQRVHHIRMNRASRFNILYFNCRKTVNLIFSISFDDRMYFVYASSFWELAKGRLSTFFFLDIGFRTTFDCLSRPNFFFLFVLTLFWAYRGGIAIPLVRFKKNSHHTITPPLTMYLSRTSGLATDGELHS